MAPQPAEHFDGWRLDIDPVWEAYNRIFFSYKRSNSESENYLRRLYRSHFIVFSYSFIDALTSKILIENFKISKTKLKDFKHLKAKVECLDKYKPEAQALSAYERFWDNIEWLRNELVHPKRRDHLASMELDNLDIDDRIARLNIYSIRAYEIAGVEFPYWLTGWNVVNSMTSGSVDQGIVVSNNTQFKVFIRGIGWRDALYNYQPIEIVQNYLVGEAIYQNLMSFLSTVGFQTQPLPNDIGFSLMPLWSKEWWDRNAMEELRKFRESRSPWNRKD